MKKGSVLVGIMIVLSGLMTIGISLSSAVLSSSIKIQRQYKKLSALAYAEAGINRGLWEINKGNLSYGSTPTLDNTLSGGQFEVLVTNCGTDCKYIVSTGYVPTKAQPDSRRTVRVKINGVQEVTNINFTYSAQSNANKIKLSNNAIIKGSAYSNGPIEMANNSKITGNATSTGNSPTISNISSGRVDGNANAYSIIGTSVGGTTTTGIYPPTQNPPISDADLNNTIDTWEAAAESGGTFNGNKNISGINNSLGPIKINGDLIVGNNAELRLTGTIWVNGNITIDNGAKVYLDSVYGNNSGIIIADYKADRTDWTKGVININNGATISGTDKNNPKTTSYTLVFSTQQPKSPAQPSNWETYPAINISNNVHGGVYYCPFGSYAQTNVAQIRAVFANGIVLRNNATLDYDGNWGNSGISYGPGGKWTITEWLILN
jgi:hypothetical protein